MAVDVMNNADPLPDTVSVRRSVTTGLGSEGKLVGRNMAQRYDPEEQKCARRFRNPWIRLSRSTRTTVPVAQWKIIERQSFSTGSLTAVKAGPVPTARNANIVDPARNRGVSPHLGRRRP